MISLQLYALNLKEIFEIEIRSCVQNLASDIKFYTLINAV